MPAVRIESEAHRKTLRQQHIGGSEVAALFGENSYLTPFELWHRKAGNIPEPDLSDSERVFWGNVLEPAIAQGVSLKNPDWTVRKVHRYMSRRPELGLGGSIDYEIIANANGPGILEIKTADWMIAKGWEDGEPPLSYELQVQTYLALTGRAWGVMAVLVGGNDLKVFRYERRPKTIDIIEAKVAEFWASIEANREPRADFSKDDATVRRLHASVADGKFIDLTGNNRAPIVMAEYQDAANQEKEAERRKRAAQAEIFSLMGDAERAVCRDYTVTAKMVSGAHIEFDRDPYRGFRLSRRKEKVGAAP